MILIIRNGKQFGPYDKDTIKQYVEDGKILKCDKCVDSSDMDNVITVKQYLKDNDISVKVKSAGSIVNQLKSIGRDIIIPHEFFKKEILLSDKKFLLLAAIGLLPSVIGFFIQNEWLMFYFVSLYFSVIWSIFFYNFFKTSQVSWKTATTIFFMTQIFIFLLWDVTGLVKLNPFYNIGEQGGFLSRLIFFIMGVGFTEEFVKAIPLFILIARAKEPLIPRTLVFYGLISGLAFGVEEGVQYQIKVNDQLEYQYSFFANIARLTYLPFIHAVFTGIAGYYIAFGNLYPKFKKSLYAMAIVVPMVLHGLYDTFNQNTFIAIFFLIIPVALLMTYLRRTSDLKSKLR
ncbi:MAG: PrsW family intramembrane metalloprotease [Paludibacteraceae bacterium]|nr:PrsW family intramembrane metalloprotease [Paludibacteraceae bacterium]